MGGEDVQTTRIRYADYVERSHKSFLDQVSNSVLAARISGTPFANHTAWDMESAFLGTGLTLASYDSLFEVFGDYLLEVNPSTLFNTVLADVVNGSVVNDMIAEEATRLSDDLEQETLPRFEAGLRDMNAVLSSSFIIGRSIIESNRTKALSRFSAETKARLIPVAIERWKAMLDWNRSVFEAYAQLMKFYIAQKMDVENHNYEISSRHKLWEFNALQYWGQALGSTGGSTTTSTELAGSSKVAKVIGSAMSGAGGGAMVGMAFGSSGGPIGAAVGGLVGLASALF